jgi:hypothetical protein
MIPRLPVAVPNGMILGLQRCSSCGNTEYVAFVDVIEVPFDFECASCHNSTSQPIGPLTRIGLNEYNALVMCVDVIDALVKDAVSRSLTRES